MKKQLKCPVCGKRLIDSEDTFKTRLMQITPSGASKEDVDYYLKCKKCNNEVGIKKVV